MIWTPRLFILIMGGVQKLKIPREANRCLHTLCWAKGPPQILPQSLKVHPAAVQEAKTLVQKLGAEIKGWYTLMGRFDEVCILEAPDDATVARVVIAVGERYAIRTETMRAFDID